eukprot:11191203-Lingulodinium_polyedra.AAC.1
MARSHRGRAPPTTAPPVGELGVEQGLLGRCTLRAGGPDAPPAPPKLILDARRARARKRPPESITRRP